MTIGNLNVFLKKKRNFLIQEKKRLTEKIIMLQQFT